MKKIVSLLDRDEEAGENLKISSWDTIYKFFLGGAGGGRRWSSCELSVCCEMKEVSSLDGLGLCGGVLKYHNFISGVVERAT